MPYPSLDDIRSAVGRLDSKRSNGLWHVLIFLRHRRLNPQSMPYELGAFSLTEECFDLNGITLPIQEDTRDCYYEPAASSKERFHQREAPRQTYLNRIQSGLSGVGPRQPNLFNNDQSVLPITVSLQPAWIQQLRSKGNALVLDLHAHDLVTWIWRFGYPRDAVTKSTVSIASHTDNGKLTARQNVEFASLPTDAAQLRELLCDFFGLAPEEVSQLMPNLAHLPGLSEWHASEPVSVSALSAALRRAPPAPPTSAALVTTPIPATSHVVNWDGLTAASTADAPLTGVANTLEKCIAALRSGKFVILLGPPGTGKTCLARHICELAVSNGAPGYAVATATSDWSTFDTLGGYLPSRDDPNSLEYSPRLIMQSLISGEWLVIDEINRADIDKAFGELFTLFAGAKVQIPGTDPDGKPYILVPPGDSVHGNKYHPVYQSKDWRIIGTMNSFDKASLFQLSYAFMRRFAFVDVPVPAADEYKNILVQACEKAGLPDAHETSPFRAPVLAYLQGLFCMESTGLGALGLRVGAAIPIDIIRFLKERYQLAVATGHSVALKPFVVEALEMYLYPQFEGRDVLHKEILRVLTEQLQLTPQEAALTESRLAIWTGFEPGSA